MENTRSGGISQGRASAAAAGGAKRRAFTDAGAEGTAREREKARQASILCFQQVPLQQLFASV